MSLLIKFIGSMIISIGGALAISNIEQTKIKIGLRQIIWILALTICTFFFTKIEFSILQSTLMFIVMILAYKEIFNFDLRKSIVMTAIIMILVVLADACAVLLTISFISKVAFRTNYFLMITGNLFISILIFCFTKIRFFSNKIYSFVNKSSNNHFISVLSEVLLTVILLLLISYNIYYNFKPNLDYFINISIYILVALILFIYIKESNNYNKLLDEYDGLLEYVQTFEEWIEDEQLELHESKNSLSAIYEMTNLEEVRKEIDKILNRKTSIEDSWVIDLKPIPKGGLKGLLYYKFMIAKNNNLHLITDVSNKVTNKLKKLSKQDSKLLFRLIGIYFDNAIEAAIESKEKNISFEVYKIKNELNIVITNTYKDNIDLNKIGKKGISTKGENRGKGTYLAKKLVSKNPKFEIKNSLLNNYYIQKITIK